MSGGPDGGRPGGGGAPARGRWRRRDQAGIDRLVERLDPFMAWLGVLFALLVGFEIAVPVSETTARVLETTGWVIWAIFVAEYLLEFVAAEDRLRFVRTHWLTALALVIPTLRLLRFVRLVRLGRAFPLARVLTSSYRAAGSTRRLLQSRLRYLAAVTTVVIIALAELAFLLERDRDTFPGFLDALVWSAIVVIGMQGDPTPASIGGRVTMLAGLLWGLVVLGALAASVGTYVVDRRG